MNKHLIKCKAKALSGEGYRILDDTDEDLKTPEHFEKYTRTDGASENWPRMTQGSLLEIASS